MEVVSVDMTMATASFWDVKYLRLNQGIVTLFINHKELCKKRFRGRDELIKITRNWDDLFHNKCLLVYTEVSFYNG